MGDANRGRVSVYSLDRGPSSACSMMVDSGRLGCGMARRKKADPVEQFFLVFFVVIIVGVVIWNLVPHWVIYTVGGILVGAIAIGVVLRLRSGNGRSLWSAFEGARSNSTYQSAFRQSNHDTIALPPLDAEERALLIEAVGGQCENSQCPNRNHPLLQVHHIIPRSREWSTNNLENLIVLCNNCHALADRHVWSQSRLQYWARRQNRFVDRQAVRDWDRMHR